MKISFAITAAVALCCVATQAVQPVAKWDAVPDRLVSGRLDIGVVAFHEKGVKVEFTANGRHAATATSRSLNPQTGIEEFVFRFEAAGFSDGPVDIGAKAVSPDGGVLELPPLRVYANPRKTLGSRKIVWADSSVGNDFAPGTKDQPVKTLKRAVGKAGDGGIVLLNKGRYPTRMIGGGRDRKFWTTIMAAPGTPREQVVMLPGRTGTDKLCFKNLLFECNVLNGYGTCMTGENGETAAWFDNCVFRNANGRYAGDTTPFGNRLRAYVTGGATEDMTCGPECELLRSHTLRRIGKCVLSPDGCLVAGCTVDDVAAEGSGDAASLLRLFGKGDGWVENTIVFGFKATNSKAHVFSGSRIKNCAFVDVEADVANDPLVTTQFYDKMTNVIFAAVDMPAQTWQWASPKNGRRVFQPSDVRLFDVKTAGMTDYTPPEGQKSGLSVSTSLPEAFSKGAK